MNNVKIATIGPIAPQVVAGVELKEIFGSMIDFWQAKFKDILPDKPDLILICEAGDRIMDDNFSLDKREEYYYLYKNKIRDLFCQTAKENNCHIVYSETNEKDGSWHNSTVMVDCKGEIATTFYKNHLLSEKDNNKSGILYRKEAPIIECDFGRVACLSCSDLEFSQVRDQCIDSNPDLLLFLSISHGRNRKQSSWAYSCRSYFVSALAEIPCEIRNPYGQVLSSNINYRDYAIGTVNLDYCMVHYDFSRQINALKEKYGDKVNIYSPDSFSSVLISSETDEITVADMIKEFKIESLDDYLAKELSIHKQLKIS